MRKIEEQMVKAIQQNKNWSNANTMVTTSADGVSNVYLHGNLIAVVDDDSVTMYDGGWQTNTTKSRLNAILEEFCIEGERVFQENWKWYVSRFVGQAGTSKVYNADVFQSGYVLS